MKIAILGAGAMGSALTVPLTDRQHTVALWCTDHDEQIYHDLSVGNPHPKLQTKLPDTVRIFKSDQIEDAIAGAELIILGVSTPGILPVIRQAAPYLRSSTPILTTAKGFLSKSERSFPVPSGVNTELHKLRSGAAPPVFSMSGPSIASELVRRQPTAVAVAGDAHDVVEAVCERLATDYFWLDSIQDLRGLEICLAYKNIYSIALAWAEGSDGPDGRASNQNLFAILLLQAADELRSLIAQCNGYPDTVNGWPGIGDLVATSVGGRNGRFGRLLAKGKSPDEAGDILEKDGVTTIEGQAALAHGINYASQAFGSNWPERLPLLHAINQVLNAEKTVGKVMAQIHRFRENN